MPARILGIESSCDETAAAVVVDGREILSNVVASQVDLHRKYGGVVPELASREHLRQIVPVVREAISQAGLNLADVDAIGVTCGPGLIGSLLVGVTYAKVLALELAKPLIAVNHLEGHVRAVFLQAFLEGGAPALPATCLIVSGGHTLLYEVRAENPEGDPFAQLFFYRRLGGTRDDAAGEAYDKVARLLALGYPGGPVIDQLARYACKPGSRSANGFNFGPIKIKGNPYDFSFSGIKTAVLYYLRAHPEFNSGIEARLQALQQGHRKASDLLPLCSPETLSLIGKFQTVVVNELLARTLAAAAETGSRTILLSGGVAANAELRETFRARCAEMGLDVRFPSRALSTDNAAMIAAAAFPRFLAGEFSSSELEVASSLPLA
jgi:N6-L-threonylcarbamoyladenine synthase